MALTQWLHEELSPKTVLFWFLFVCCFLVVGLNSLSKNNRRSRKLNLPPSPPRLPIIGNLHQLGSMPQLSFWRLSQKYGPIIHLELGEIPTVVVSSARLAKEALKTNDLALAGRPLLFTAKNLIYGCADMTFAPYGAYWRNIRKICTLEILSAKRVQSYNLLREEEVARMVRRIAVSYPGTTNISKMVGLFANDVLCRTAFSRYFAKEGNDNSNGFQKMVDETEVLLGGFSLADLFPSMEWIHSITGMKARIQNNSQCFDRFFDEIIQEHLDSNRDDKEHKDLLDVLLYLHKEGDTDMPLTMDNVKGVMMDMFAAGTSTTSIILDWGMTELLMNPEVMKKAQAEVRSVVGERRFVAENDLPQLHYMRAIIKEIFRLHPPTPLLVPRESLEEVTIDQYSIPARTRFFVNAWAIGRDPESWDDPQIFKPERFMGSSINFRGQDFELIPFGAGRRACPGITFGIASVELALAQLLHSFDWELPPGTKITDIDNTEQFGLTMHRISGLTVVAKPHFPYD